MLDIISRYQTRIMEFGYGEVAMLEANTHGCQPNQI